MSNTRNDRRTQRQTEAAERLARNEVINCMCGNRHAVGSAYCRIAQQVSA